MRKDIWKRVPLSKKIPIRLQNGEVIEVTHTPFPKAENGRPIPGSIEMLIDESWVSCDFSRADQNTSFRMYNGKEWIECFRFGDGWRYTKTMRRR